MGFEILLPLPYTQTHSKQTLVIALFLTSKIGSNPNNHETKMRELEFAFEIKKQKQN